jgi:hypothetical protein
MRKARIAGALVSVAAAAALLTIPAVSGASHRWDVDIRTVGGKPFLHGVLQSQNEGCERDRYVYVKRIRPGFNTFKGADWSSRNGAWSVDVNRAGDYKVFVDGVGVCGGDAQRVNNVPAT